LNNGGIYGFLSPSTTPEESVIADLRGDALDLHEHVSVSVHPQHHLQAPSRRLQVLVTLAM